MGKTGWRKLEQVICRQESRADEKPLKFRWQGRWIQIESIRSNWLERGPGETDSTYRVFEVTSELGPCLLRIAKEGWVWELKELSAAALRES